MDEFAPLNFPPKRRSAPPTAWVLATKRGGGSEKADAERTTCRLWQRGGEGDEAPVS